MDNFPVHDDAGRAHNAEAHDGRHIGNLFDRDGDTLDARLVLNQLGGGDAILATGAKYFNIFKITS